MKYEVVVEQELEYRFVVEADSVRKAGDLALRITDNWLTEAVKAELSGISGDESALDCISNICTSIKEVGDE